MISLFFATIAGTKAIENSRASNVSEERKVTPFRRESAGLLTMFSRSMAHRAARTARETVASRIVPEERPVRIFDKLIVWEMPIARQVVDEPGKGVAFIFLKYNERLRRGDPQTNVTCTSLVVPWKDAWIGGFRESKPSRTQLSRIPAPGCQNP